MVNIQKYSVRLVKEEGRRYDLDKKINDPQSAGKLFDEVLSMQDRPQEVFAMATLDIKNQVTGVFEVSIGSVSSSIVHPRDVFQRAILQNAAAIIICHNHPSGVNTPSKEDIEITHRLLEAGKILGIDVLDHILIGDNYYSMKEHGII
ncbi:MAG: DNA repair protein RadC [Halanaerobiaceae bacterium]|nr:DNA repair protein RadC [Halanaerobiaceae bacterium]